MNPVGLLGQAYIDVDRSDGPGQGNIYVLASMVRLSNGDPGDVMFAKSMDGGYTWSTPLRINNDPTAFHHQWFGTMSVAPNGRIDVVWLDTRNDPDLNIILREGAITRGSLMAVLGDAKRTDWEIML